jgi:hypothetical protein
MVVKAPYLAKLTFEPVAVPLVKRRRHQWKRRVLGAANADRANEHSPAFDADGVHGGPYRPERRLYFSRQPPSNRGDTEDRSYPKSVALIRHRRAAATRRDPVIRRPSRPAPPLALRWGSGGGRRPVRRPDPGVRALGPRRRGRAPGACAWRGCREAGRSGGRGIPPLSFRPCRRGAGAWSHRRSPRPGKRPSNGSDPGSMVERAHSAVKDACGSPRRCGKVRARRVQRDPVPP